MNGEISQQVNRHLLRISDFAYYRANRVSCGLISIDLLPVREQLNQSNATNVFLYVLQYGEVSF